MHSTTVRALFGAAALSAMLGVFLPSTDLSTWAVLAWLAAALLTSTGAILADLAWGALATAAVAAGCNAYLLYGKFTAAAGPSACTINDYIDCDKVNNSAYSEMFGLPITLFGLGFYLGLVVLAYNARTDEAQRETFFKTNGLFAIINLAYSAFLAWASVEIGALCVVCITIYICNGLLLWTSLRSGLTLGSVVSGGLGSLGSSLPTLAVVFLGTTAIGSNLWNEAQEGDVSQAAAAVSTGDAQQIDWSRIYSEAKGAVEWDGSEPMLGSEDAPYLVVEWADFGCPHCAVAKEELTQLVKAFPDVAVRFKPFPLSGNCNDALAPTEDNLRCNAAMAGVCAHKQGKFWEMSHLMFTNQGYFTQPDLQRMAEQSGLDLAQYGACMADPTTVDTVKANAAAGDKVGIQGTPAMFLYGAHGDAFVEVKAGTRAIPLIIEAHKQGSLPPRQP